MAVKCFEKPLSTQLLVGVLGSLIFGIGQIRADVLGSFDQVRNYPGYIDFNPRSALYKGNAKHYAKDDGVERRTPSGILASFVKDNQFDAAKAEEFIQRVQVFQHNAFLSYCSVKLSKKISRDHRHCLEIDWLHPEQVENEGVAKFVRKWQEKEGYLAPQMAVDRMTLAMESAAGVDFNQINSPLFGDFLESFMLAIEAFESIKAEDAYWGLRSAKVKEFLSIGRNFLGSGPVVKDGRVESANLPVPDQFRDRFPNQMFLSPEQAENLQLEGFDIALIDPQDSGFWRKPQVHPKDYEPKTYNRRGVASLQARHTDKEIADLFDDDVEIRVTFEDWKSLRGTTPKIYVTYGKDEQKWKMKFLTDVDGAPSSMDPAIALRRTIVSSEVNIEPVVNAIADMIGYTVDPTYYKRKVRMYFPEKVYEEDRFEQELAELLENVDDQFDPSWNIRSGFAAVKTDDDGRQYIEFRSVTLEKKSDIETDRNIAHFVRHGLGKSFKREFRAFGLFLALILDPDCKDDNTRVKLIPQGGRWQLGFSASDMGISLGFGYPNIYGKELVSKAKYPDSGGDVSQYQLNYWKFFPLPILDTMSHADARWLLRWLALIPRSKVVEVFEAAAHPKLVAEYFADIFLRRLDQLIEVYGMAGQTYPSFDGEFVVEKQSRMDDPETYAIAGHESSFVNGNIIDPENTMFDSNIEPFARNWGTSVDLTTPGKHQAEFRKVFTRGLILQGGNLVQRVFLENFQLQNAMLNDPFCRGNCYYSGTRVGVDWFIPMRFVVPNRMDSKFDYPYLIVDMARFALNLGYGSRTVLESLGSDFSKNLIGLGGGFVSGVDFVKIRPVRDYGEALSVMKTDDPDKRKLHLFSPHKEFINNMGEGEVLITSHYISTFASLRISPDMGVSRYLTQTAMEMGIEGMITNRTYMMRGTNNNILVNWADVNSLNAYASSNIRSLVFFKIPEMANEFRKSSRKDRTFEFRLDDPVAKDLILAHASATNPPKEAHKYRLKTREVHSLGRKSWFNIFYLASWNFRRGQTEVRGVNHRTGKKVHEVFYEQEYKFGGFSSWDIINKLRTYVRAQVNDLGELFTRTEYRLKDSEASREEFVEYYKKVAAIVPPDFVLFDPKSVKKYMGAFELESEVIIDRSGYDALFADSGPDSMDLCLALAESFENDPRKWCSRALRRHHPHRYQMDAVNFIKQFQQAKGMFRRLRWDMPDHPIGRRHALRMLKKLVGLMKYSHSKVPVVTVLQKFIPEKSIHREVTMTSFLEGFPGIISSLETSPGFNGALKMKARYLSDDVADLFEVFTDKIDQSLQSQSLLTRTSRRD